MEYTGERPLDGHGMDRALALYAEAAKFCRGKVVLDYGCGVGAGTNLLSKTCMARGYDVSEEAVTEAHKAYPHIMFTSGSPSLNGVNYVVCLEVIEHLERRDVWLLLEGLAGLHMDGFFSTPNGDLFPYHPETIEQRRGFHKWHFTREELDELFRPFGFYSVCGMEWDAAIKKFVTYGIHVWGNR